MRILVVNDDGIDAPGIQLLTAVAAKFGDEVWVVAPDHQCSAMSQRITLREKLYIQKVDFEIKPDSFYLPEESVFSNPCCLHAYKISGTPADCVKVALTYLMPERPDYVFSGVNLGFNCGHDIAYSGTIGAALEAAMDGVPAIAFSAAAWGSSEVLKRYIFEITSKILQKEVLTTAVFNVNFPGCTLDQFRGILWDREVASVQYYQDNFDSVDISEGRTELTVHGMPLKTEQIPEGSDLRAVLEGYVSIGTVNTIHA